MPRKKNIQKEKDIKAISDAIGDSNVRDIRIESVGTEYMITSDDWMKTPTGQLRYHHSGYKIIISCV